MLFEISSDDAKYRKIAGLNLRGKGNERNDGTFENLFLNEIGRDKMRISSSYELVIFIVRNLSKHQITLNALYSHDISSTGSSIIPSSLYTRKPLSRRLIGNIW